MELLQNFVQCLLVYYEKKTLSTKNGVASKFCANVYMCSVKKTFLPKMELLQNFVQTFTCVV